MKRLSTFLTRDHLISSEVSDSVDACLTSEFLSSVFVIFVRTLKLQRLVAKQMQGSKMQGANRLWKKTSIQRAHLMDRHQSKLQCLGGMIGCSYSKLFCGVTDWVVGSLEWTFQVMAVPATARVCSMYSNQMLRVWLMPPVCQSWAIFEPVKERSFWRICCLWALAPW